MGGAEFIHMRFGKMVWTEASEDAPQKIVLTIASSAVRTIMPASTTWGDRPDFART
jgi:hypothetical protein